MTERIQKDELAHRLAECMKTDPQTAEAWLDALVETLYDRIVNTALVLTPASFSVY